ncbi:YkgJ family cysteine cluster protein [Desulfovibrio aminophilus]|nr:YkgJ family cysteine cluster protein [Desulfovibrio aminophilus]MCM0754786.1 YkgJ family cysteine cluster protein [Desulfovibrio aminophilus]
MTKDATEQFLDSLPELKPGETFRFACHPGVPCFNACCGDLNLMLTPYDTLRLRRGLGGLPSRLFVEKLAEISARADGFPTMRLRMEEGARKPCPFVRPEGCSIYADRPGACRTYPLGRATRPGEDGVLLEQFFVVREPHCRGFEQEGEWTAESWLKDQGLEPYNEANDRYMRLVADWRAAGRGLDSRRAGMVFLALYQPDDFQRFLRDMKMFERLEAEPGREERVMADEEAALDFGLDWLRLTLLGQAVNLRPRGA